MVYCQYRGRRCTTGHQWRGQPPRDEPWLQGRQLFPIHAKGFCSRYAQRHTSCFPFSSLHFMKFNAADLCLRIPSLPGLASTSEEEKEAKEQSSASGKAKGPKASADLSPYMNASSPYISKGGGTIHSRPISRMVSPPQAIHAWPVILVVS